MTSEMTSRRSGLDPHRFLADKARPIQLHGGKLLIKPSKAAIGRIRKRLAAEARAVRGSNAPAFLAATVPVTRDGRPTIGVWCRRGCSPASTTTCGSSLTSGRNTATRTSRSPGSSNGTTAGSPPPGRTTGYSGTAPAVPTCPSSPGRHPESDHQVQPGRPRAGRRAGRNSPRACVLLSPGNRRT
jgi:hypothetical protein